MRLGTGLFSELLDDLQLTPLIEFIDVELYVNSGWPGLAEGGERNVAVVIEKRS